MYYEDIQEIAVRRVDSSNNFLNYEARSRWNQYAESLKILLEKVRSISPVTFK